MLVHRQTPHLRQSTTTAHLAQTMSLLELTALELRQKIETELASNPALELVDEYRCGICGRILPARRPCPVCTRPNENVPEAPIVFLSTRQDFFPPGRSALSSEEPSEDDFAAEQEDLPVYVLRQISVDLEPEDRPIAAHILTSLNKDGLLETPLAEIARYHFVPLARVERVIRLIQHADPLGVGSPSPQAALLVQLEVLSETQSVPAGTDSVIKQGMDLLSRHAYHELGRRLGLTVARIKLIAQFISQNLNPFPARTHWGESNSPKNGRASSSQVYYSPDVIISRLNDQPDTALVVEIATPVAGTLRINPLFREALQNAPDEKSAEWRADYDHAVLLVKCLQQRNMAFVRLLQRLVVLQRDFILYGDEHIQPLTRASLAVALDVHESTISRAVADKAIQLPNGHILPLSRFFDRSLHIRTALKQIIDQENRPLSDTELAGLLANEGFSVARRTVAKYRAMEGILPAHLRQCPE